MNALDILAAAAFTVFAWWFCTGVIFYLDGLPKRTYWLSLASATVVATCAFIGLITASRFATPAGAYAAFSCTLLVWGWQEMLFLMGALAGSSREPCPLGVSEATRFRLATRAVLHHELALLGGGLLLLMMTWGAPNQVGAATYFSLWLMRLSAKLNLFVGVRNTYAHLLPEHLAYLGSFFRQRQTTSRFFVLSSGLATLLTIAAWSFVSSATNTAFARTGASLVATLLTLAVVEHLFLVLPIPMEKLWATVLSKRDRRPPGPSFRLANEAVTSAAAPELSSLRSPLTK